MTVTGISALAVALVAVTEPTSIAASAAKSVVISVAPEVPHALGRKEITCPYASSNNDDMLVHPGVVGATHEHDYFGALGVTALTTVDSIRGNGTSCPQTADESGYWAPSLHVGTATFRPTAAHIYYERNTNQKVTAFPPGFHMIVGAAMSTSDGSGNPHIFFGCAGTESGRSTQVNFPTCYKHSQNSGPNTFAIWLEFPNCWDGLPARGPSMSVVYATGAKAQCPADHPVLLPTLRTTLWYDLPPTQTLQGVSLSSGPMGSAHADYVNGWTPAAMTSMVNCINTGNRACP